MQRAYFNSPIGVLELVCENDLICELNFVKEIAKVNVNNDILKLALNELELYFSGNLQKFSIPLKFHGTEFEREIYNQLLEIPYGTTITYARLAKNAGHERAFRAAGSANAKNKIPIIIPCHRVVSSNGLGGYSGMGGIQTKKFLIDFERENS